jgi:glycine/D-amino acid oxidase-like deaminating enzyme
MRRALSRRALLQGGVALASLRGWGADALPALRGDEVLPDPDFSQLHERTPHLVGVRPHRLGGVRLELDPAPLGGKRVLHNYGHGGGGITLSWGCAARVVTLLEPLASRSGASVAVLGAGVIGLTTATELRRRWPRLELTVYAKDLEPRSTTSWIAGGQFEPSGIYKEYEKASRKPELAALLRASKARVVELQRSGQRQRYGVAERKQYTLDHEVPGMDLHTPRDVVPAFRRGTLPFKALHGVGREYSTWLQNPTLLLPALVEDLKAAGVKFEQRTFASRDELGGLPASLLVNCTGLGAKALFDDAKVVPQRGHLVVLQKTDPKQFYFFAGGCENFAISYAFCRQDDVVLGGSVIPNDDQAAITDADAPHFERILSNARLLFGGQPNACVK